MSDHRAAPDVSVVIPTREREELLAKALAAVSEQRYDGRIEVVLVYDQAEPVTSHERADADRTVRVVSNIGTPGLAGARNAGIAQASGALIAFCDDDDLWRPDKLRLQVERLRESGAPACVTGIAIHYQGRIVERIPPVRRITPELLRTSRLTGAHPSSYLMTQEACERVGPVDEGIPGGYGEDFDWLVRLATIGPVEVLQEPLVDVLWHRGSFFTRRWSAMYDSVDYLLEKYPELQRDRVGLARLRGQQAFALAAQGRRADAVRTAWRTIRLNPREQRGYVAALVASGLVSASRVMHTANARGRGI
jgi:glycosyltransferase involved in cell wall biosynthesis